MPILSTSKFLNSFIDYEKKWNYSPKKAFRLDRVRYVLNKMGNPERCFRTILVGGTKGKGSTAAILASILKEAGYRVGMYTSPHLGNVRERLRVNSYVISEEDWTTLIGELEDMKEGGLSPFFERRGTAPRSSLLTYFEVLTIAAILYFSKKKVDLGIFEVGLGGRLDATNVLDPSISILTPISMDHRALLGKTLGQIAKEKAAIIRKGRPAVIGDQHPEARRVIARRANSIKAISYKARRDFHCKDVQLSTTGLRFSWSSNGSHLKDLNMPLLGSFQADNASSALEACHILNKDLAFSISERDVRCGLRKVYWPGRIHILQRRPLIIADGAHNGASIEALLDTLNQLFPGKNLNVIMGVSQGKELRDMLKVLKRAKCASFIATSSRHPRALPARELGRIAKGYLSKVSVRPSLEGAFSLAAQSARSDSSLILITGSLFLAGEALRKFGKPIS